MNPTPPPDNDQLLAAYQELSFPVAVELGNYHVAHLQRLCSAFHGDLLLPLILGEVASFNLRKVRGSLRKEKITYADARCASTMDNSCNALSVSVALGLPRETVRRKICALIEQGYLERTGGRHLRTTSKAFEEFSPSFNLETLREFLATAERLRQLLELSSHIPKHASPPTENHTP